MGTWRFLWFDWIGRLGVVVGWAWFFVGADVGSYYWARVTIYGGQKCVFRAIRWTLLREAEVARKLILKKCF